MVDNGSDGFGVLQHPHLSWPAAPGSGLCRGIGDSRGRTAETTSEEQLAQQLQLAGLATGHHCPASCPGPRSTHTETWAVIRTQRFTKKLPV